MSKIIKLTYEAADARGCYAKIHESIFKLSLRGMIAVLNRRKWIDYEIHHTELSNVSQSLDDIEIELSLIDDTEMSRIRGGVLIRLALLEYVQALGQSVRMLKGICERYINDRGEQREQNELATAKASYDAAVQYHRHLGDRLNQLLSTF